RRGRRAPRRARRGDAGGDRRDLLGQLPAALCSAARRLRARRRPHGLLAPRRALHRHRLLALRLDWMIHALGIARVEDDEEDLVVDYGRGLNVLAQFLFGRFYMYAQVYYHKTVRAAEHMFSKVMERFARLAVDGSAPAGLPVAARLARGEPVGVGEYLGL